MTHQIVVKKQKQLPNTRLTLAITEPTVTFKQKYPINSLNTQTDISENTSENSANGC